MFILQYYIFNFLVIQITYYYIIRTWVRFLKNKGKWVGLSPAVEGEVSDWQNFITVIVIYL